MGTVIDDADPYNQRSGVPSNMTSLQFSTFVSRRWDINGDSIITKAEWDGANAFWFGSNFALWDKNKNGIMDTPELLNFFSESKLYQIYDRNNDGIIDDNEAVKIPLP